MGVWQKCRRWVRAWLRQRLLNLLHPLDPPTFPPPSGRSGTVDALKERYEVEITLTNQQLQIYQQQNKALLEILKIMAENPTPNISASSGSFVNTGEMKLTGSTINLGEISGTVTNTLQQMQDSTEPTVKTLANLLQQLQTAVQNEPDLDDKTKAKALKHLESLAQLGNDRSDSTLQEKAETAWDALTGILGKTIKLAPIVETVLPQIQTLLGF
jgi:hypothetical protein